MLYEEYPGAFVPGYLGEGGEYGHRKGNHGQRIQL